MHTTIKRTALALCLLASLSTPALAAGAAPVPEARLISALPAAVKVSGKSVTEQTRITIKEGEQVRPGTLSDLEVGARVEVKWTGPMLKSYPGRGTAAEILFLR